MKNFISRLFKDGNDINEKSVLGFASFFVMVIFAVADIITGSTGKGLVINEFIFDAFMIITISSLGIASVDKYINSRSERRQQTNTSSEESTL